MAHNRVVTLNDFKRSNSTNTILSDNNNDRTTTITETITNNTSNILPNDTRNLEDVLGALNHARDAVLPGRPTVNYFASMRRFMDNLRAAREDNVSIGTVVDPRVRDLVLAFRTSRSITASIMSAEVAQIPETRLDTATALATEQARLSDQAQREYDLTPPPDHPWLYLLGVTVFAAVGIGAGYTVGRRILDTAVSNPSLQQDSKELFRIFGYALKFIKL